MGLLEFFQRSLYGEVTWPPKELADHWERIRGYRRRFENDTAEMLRHTPYFSVSPERAKVYTPVPLTREMARYSAALLFSDPPKVTLQGADEMEDSGIDAEHPHQDLLDRILEANGLDPFLQAAAEQVAVEGRGAIRIIRDDEVAGGEPYLTHVSEDQIVWDVRHGRAVVGGACIQEYTRETVGQDDYYRLMEWHGVDPEFGGYIRRRLYQGKSFRLGEDVPLDAIPETAGFEEEEWTGLDVPTLIRWDNVPGGYSDVAGVDALLERLDEAESLFVLKGRRSTPLTFADRSLADESGDVDLEGVILTGDSNMDAEFGSSVTRTVEVAQPQLQTDEHKGWIDHLREMILTHTGYSQSSWGIGELGRSDSGTALKLRQGRTLHTRSGKERMAVEAITNALAAAMAWSDGDGAERAAKDYRPLVMLGDGLPFDSMERAQEVATRRTAGVVSLWQAVREQHPDWLEEDVQAEVERIREEEAAAPNVETVPGGLSLDDGEDEETESEEEDGE